MTEDEMEKRQECEWDAHISTGMYSFLGFSGFKGTLEEALAKYREVEESTKPRPVNELPQKEWRDWLDKYIKGESVDSDSYSKMSPNQVMVVQEIKKSKARNNK